MTLEAVPPGQQPTSTMPTVNASSSAKILASVHASRGMTVNCARQPMTTSFGRLNTMRKSSARSVRPMPNIITPSSGLITVGFTWLIVSGNTSAAIADNNTSTPIYSDM